MIRASEEIRSEAGGTTIRMASYWKLLVLAAACLGVAYGQFDGEQKWGYFNVREGVHMFYWFFYSVHPDGYQTRPLLIWHQGGPGASSTGYGNWEIIGPLDYNMDYRNTTWVQEANVLFIDSPVGSGWSYVDSQEYFTTDMQGITDDLTATLGMFLDDTPEFKGFPLYFFGQSYGGKVAPAAVLSFHEAVQRGELDVDLKAFAMGNAWTSPLDSTLTWADFCYEMSTTDEQGRDEIQAAAVACQQAFDAGDHTLATLLWSTCQGVLLQNTNYVNMYNILEYYGDPQSMQSINGQPAYKPGGQGQGRLDVDEEEFMNTVVREMLGDTIPEDVVYGAQSDQVFNKQSGDFMDNEIPAVNTLLQTTDIQAIVYQGQLDIICLNTGAMEFVKRFEWDGKDGFYSASRRPLTDPEGYMEMFVTSYQKFKYYWVLNGGHAVPADVPEPAYRMLLRILDDVDN